MYTAMAVIALTMTTTSSNLSSNPSWNDDYRVAVTRVAESGKPMIVFVGTGKNGFEAVVREGAFDATVTKMLASKFVCVYVDTTTATGRSLADALQINRVGVVISDKAGTSQAYSSSVAIPRTELVRAMEKYADVKEIKGTEIVQAGGAAPAAKAPPAAHAPMGGGTGAGYAHGGGGCCGWSLCCGKGTSTCGKRSSGCCGWSFCGLGSCCGKGTVVVVQPAAPKADAKPKAPEAKPAPAPAPKAQPVSTTGGCCGWSLCCGKGYTTTTCGKTTGGCCGWRWCCK